MRPGTAAFASLAAVPLFAAAAVALATLKLPTEWSLQSAPAQVAATGTLPMSVRLTADGAHLVVVEGGEAGAAVSVFDPETLAAQGRLKLAGAFGDIALDAAGDGFWLATAGTNSLVHIFASTVTVDRTVPLPRGFWAISVARSPNGKVLATSGEQADQVALVDAVAGTVFGTVKVGPHPAG